MAKYRVETDNGVYEVETDESANPESADFERGPNYPNAMATTGAPSLDVAMAVDAAPKLAMAAPKLIKAVPGVVRGLAEGAGDIGGTIAELGSKARGAVSGGWDALTGNTPRGFGYAKNALGNPAMREGAANAIDMANEAQPELGKLVEQAARRPIAGAPGDVAALPTGEKGLATAEDVANFPPGPGEAPLDMEKPDTSMFQTPIRQGIMSGPEDMFNAAETQRKAVGDAIEKTLAKYDSTNTFYDPTAVNNTVKSMLERDAAGNVMTTGWQGEVNDAMKKALSSLSDFSQGAPVKWSDAARIKTGLQTMGDYAAKNSDMANEAYKQVASLLKEDIDKQATEMLAKQGGNVQDYQALRSAYGKLEGLSQALNNRVAAKSANSTIPWWVKMAAGSVLAGKAMGVVKGIAGH